MLSRIFAAFALPWAARLSKITMSPSSSAGARIASTQSSKLPMSIESDGDAGCMEPVVAQARDGNILVQIFPV